MPYSFLFPSPTAGHYFSCLYSETLLLSLQSFTIQFIQVLLRNEFSPNNVP